MSGIKYIYNSPKNWIWIALDEVSLKITDGSHNPPKKEANGIPMLSAQNITNNHISFENVRYISHEDFVSESERANVEEGDVLLTIVGSIGRAAFVPEALKQQFAIQRSVALIKPSKFLNGKFLMYAIQAPFFQKQLDNNAKGTAQKGVYLNALKSFSIPLISLKEQYQIIEKIEELFSEIDNAEETIVDATFKLEVCKNSVLEQILFKNDSREQLIPIGDVVNRISTKVYPSTSPDLKFVGLDSIVSKTLEISRVYNFKDYASSGNYFEKGHVLYSRMRPYLNKATKATFDGAASGEYIVLECKEDILNDYLLYILHSGTFVNYATQKSAGDRPRLSFEDLAQFQIYLGNLEEQVRAINDIEYYFTIIDNLQRTLNEAENQIIILRQSILKKAFEGLLIEYIDTDESAHELIDRIKQEKTQYMETQKRIAKSKPQKQKIMEEKKTILEILQAANAPLLTEDVWHQSEHKNNIENFYAELKRIQNQIVATKKSAESFLSLKK